jgi:hypothetical protein
MSPVSLVIIVDLVIEAEKESELDDREEARTPIENL